MSFITIGIDPGQHGGIVILNENGDPIFAVNMPRVGDVYDYNTINAIFEEYSKVPAKVAIELVGFMGAETAKNISDLVHHAGVLYGLSIAHSLPIVLAPPSVWKKKIGLPPIGIAYAKKGETNEDKKKRVNENARKRRSAKNVSIEHAIRLMPKLEETLGSKINDGVAEAALIGEYVRRVMSNTD
jgi:predicted transcriptional regulator